MRLFFIYSLFWKFDSLRNQKCGTQFSLKKGFVFRISRQMSHQWIHLLRFHIEKNLKKIKSEKWIFSRFLFYFSIFCSKKLFYFQNIWKKHHRFKRVVIIPFQMYQKIWAGSWNGGPGGRLAPPASKCHKKKVSQGGSFTLLQIVKIGHIYQR